MLKVGLQSDALGRILVMKRPKVAILLAAFSPSLGW
jgi:hypothetical protein